MNHKCLRSFMISFLAVFMAAAVAVSASADFRRTITLADGLAFEEFYEEPPKTPQHGFIFTYTPGKDVLPILTAGSGVYGRERVTAMADALRKQGADVLGGTNADFFSFLTGIPLGVMIENGRVLSSDAGANAFGIREDGTCVLGCPEVKISLTRTADGLTLPVAHINKYPAVWGAYLSTPDLGVSTHSTEDSTEIVFRILDGDFRIGASVIAEITGVFDNSKNIRIPENGFAITVHNKASCFSSYTKLKTGDRTELAITASPGWENVVTAVGGGDILIRDGVIQESITDEDHERYRNPRTAIGRTAEGDIRIFVMDGVPETSGSSGLTLDGLAKTMRDLGCTDALNLDGGGSSTVLLKKENGTLTMANQPPETNGRAVSNAILFVNTAAPDGVPYFAELTPDTPLIFGNPGIQFSPIFRDKSRAVTEAPENAEYQWSCTGGTITENGYFTPYTKLLPGYLDEPTVTLTVTVPVPETDVEEPEITEQPETPETPEITESPETTDIPDITDIPEIPEDVPEEIHSGDDAPAPRMVFGVVTVRIQRTAVLDSLKVQNPGLQAELGQTTESIRLEGTLRGYPVVVDAKTVTGVFSASGTTRLPEAILNGSLQVKNRLSAENTPFSVYKNFEVRITAPARNGGTLIARTSVRTAVSAENTFSDLTDHWAKNDILTLYCRGIVSGISDGNGGYAYQPGEPLTRGAFAKMITLLTRETGTDTAGTAVSVSAIDLKTVYLDGKSIPAWAAPYVRSVTAAGLMKGKGVEGGVLFDTDASMTRAEVLNVLSAILSAKEFPDRGIVYADDDQIPAWAAEAVRNCTNAGLVNGFPDGTVRTSAIISRAEAAALLCRITGVLNETEPEAPETSET